MHGESGFSADICMAGRTTVGDGDTLDMMSILRHTKVRSACPKGKRQETKRRNDIMSDGTKLHFLFFSLSTLFMISVYVYFAVSCNILPSAGSSCFLLPSCFCLTPFF